MKNKSVTYSKVLRWQKLALAASLALPLYSFAATVNLATEPLTKSTSGAKVLPNILFILDDSGSMDWNYLPDWANSSLPWLRNNAEYNGVAYNPGTRYSPPVKYDSNGALNYAYDSAGAVNTSATYQTQRGQDTTSGADSSTKPNWRKVKDDAYGIQSTSTSNLEGNASYYTFVAGEYCTSPDLKTCTTASATSTSYPYAANLRWCNSTALTTCQATKNGTFKYARYAGMPSTTTITVNNPTSSNSAVSSITVNGKQILSGTTSPASTNRNDVASYIASNINNCTSAISGNCTVAGYSATVSGRVVTITSPPGGMNTYTPNITSSGSITYATSAFSGGTPGSIPLTTITSSTTSYPFPGTTSKGISRTDCSGTTCTYAEEMTNYANWWAYYHTRMQSMKTSVSRAFKDIDNRYRVGYSTISNTGAADSSEFLHIDKFETTHKYNWFTKLFGANPTGSTPLRSALAKAGKVFAHKVSSSAPDPVQFSCQQNFAILSTDGYWNTGSEFGTLSLDNGNVGNLDSGTSVDRPMREGVAASDTLADIAKYYYDTDLRTTARGNCTGGPDESGNTHDVCENNVYVSTTDNNPQQHMTTFTMGLGADGTLAFYTDYTSVKQDDLTSTPNVTYTAPSGVPLDWYNLLNGYAGVNWPDPINNANEERIDDLWHAAVNGHGVYFSAKQPDEIVAGFTKALASITAKLGAGAAAATSTLNPVAGNNFAYVASYTTVKWIGNLEARTINITTGEVSKDATWCAEDVIATTCTSPSSIVKEITTSGTVYYCVTPNSSTATCSGTLSGTDCKVQAATSCSGTMSSKVSDTSDTRTIYMNVSGSLASFNYSNLTAAGLNSTFDTSFLSSNLYQWSSFTSAQKTAAAGANLVNYLRGQVGYENRSGNLVGTTDNRLFRFREAVMGDAIDSKPAFVGKPTFSYTDPGYTAFKTANINRSGTIYMGTNEGMLHAFNASNGQERWAYVPSLVIPNMWKLANSNYASNHVFFTNGSPLISDICTANCTDATTAVWKTILVAGLSSGGRGYYALDITNPNSPSLLWEFNPTNDMGYTYGSPIVTKKANGTWVVMLTSGYNNTTGTYPGKGILYVLNANSGTVIDTYPTSVGSATTPSGLSKISAWAENAEKNNIVSYTYGGDLLGNVWRFDINTAPASGTNPFLFATLYSDAAATMPQAITTRPVLGLISGKRVVYIGTGKYLETGDLDPDSSVDRDPAAGKFQTQSIYAIKDDNATATFTNPRTFTSGTNKMVQQTITTSGSNRTATSNPVDFATGRGWYADLPDNGERQHVDGLLVLGTLLLPTTVPSNTTCAPGGYGWLNYLNFKTGSAVSPTNLVSTRANAPIVGINVFYINGQPVVGEVTADDPTPKIVKPPFTGTPAGFQKKRVIWRELIQ
ncbi:pilus assembly protein [Sulfurirhabdus autotrophica]|uniref:Type IV pilus assembly protein PilY1 n=1 Tax=Sulfurirhabdus autotrophica TaxID=1706046 RepID=A0A4R3YAD3_9PROT|nr:PilC/PilY family type IV pilus protein [Sulfurirhabdus autotrophica]TCV88957.1 type IV pilus assembly protein PilY1 [Sulfurirhabdus autotrophica]